MAEKAHFSSHKPKKRGDALGRDTTVFAVVRANPGALCRKVCDSMAKNINQLSARSVATIKDPGLHCDGNGLYLRVGASGSRSWIFRYMVKGRSRSMGLGPALVVPLADARDLALGLRRQVLRGIDPLEAKQQEIAKAQVEVAKTVTFKECAEGYIAAHRAGWSNDKHAAQWSSTLATYAFPEVGDRSVAAVDTAAIMKILDPIWSSKTETANRVRNRIECVLDWAAAKGLRDGANPARMKGHLDNLLPPRRRVSKVRHHPALPYSEAASFLSELRTKGGMAALALEFCILTCARTGEAIAAQWSEIDFEKKLWTVPAERMKTRRPHRVPLSDEALRLLRHLEKAKAGPFVFPGAKSNRTISNMSMLAVLRRMERRDITVHGFRSTFRDWAAETTEFPNELVEMALSHTVGNQVEAAYRRGDMLERRQKLMDEWARHCFPKLRPVSVHSQDNEPAPVAAA